MIENRTPTTSKTADHSRRNFLKLTGAATAGAAATSVFPSGAHAADDQTIRLALIGCGGRGTGAVGDALSVPDGGPMELHAMADIDEKAIEHRRTALERRFKEKINVPQERRFIGFDAYKKAIDILRPGDVALCTTRAYIRPVHVEYAVSRGINVFMEKPFASDPGSLHRMYRAGENAKKTGSKIAAGLQCRHSPARKALLDQIADGALGEVSYVCANRWGGPNNLRPQGDNANNLISQLNFGRIGLLWVGSGHMVDYLIHQIDETCWIMGDWPVSCRALAGRTPETIEMGQNLDSYAMEYTFADGRKAFCGFRTQENSTNDFATYIHGTKCAAQFSGNVHRATVHKFKDQRIGNEFIDWTPPADQHSPWQYEWNDFVASIRGDREHNEALRAVKSDLTTLMGRAACHTGREVTWDQMMASTFQFCNYLDDLDYNSEAPVKADGNGKFPQPIPGKWTEV